MVCVRHVAFGALMLCPVVTGAQIDTQKYPDFKRVFSTDTLPFVSRAQLSPDGRWVAIAASQGQGSALFLGRVGTRELTRLTNNGFSDDGPIWFPRSDRIAFTSNRPNRNGAPGSYGMVLDIDPNTGRPRGMPRQVTLDSAAVVQPSPDGQWLAVTSPGKINALTLVPANGGTARTLVAPNGRVVGAQFTPDGKFIYYKLYGADNKGDTERIAVSTPGAKPVRVYTGNGRFDASILANDPRYILVDLPGEREMTAEIRTFDGTVVGKVAYPTKTRGMWFTPDGWGWMWAADSGAGWATQLVSTSGGAVRTITTPKSNTLVMGWLADGSAIVSMGGRQSASGESMPVIDVTPVEGGPVRTFTASGAARTFSVVGNEAGYVKAVPGAGVAPANALMAIDLRNGTTRTLSNSIAPRSIRGPGGWGNAADRFYWAERDGQTLTVYAEAPGIGKRTLRAFSLPKATPHGLHVSGTRVAWAEPVGDSILISVTDDATSAPRTLIGFAAKPAEVLSMAWSNDGRRIAVSHHLAGRPAAVSIVEVPASGAAPLTRTVTVDSELTEIFWAHSDAAVGGAMLLSGGKQALVVVALGSGQMTILNREDPRQLTGAVAVSPDGKQFAYSVVGDGGGTILYTFDFRRAIQAVTKK